MWPSAVTFYRGRSLEWFAGYSTIVTGMEKFRLKPVLPADHERVPLSRFEAAISPNVIDVFDAGEHIASYRWSLTETKSWVREDHRGCGLAARVIYESAVRFGGYRRCANRSAGGHRSHKAAWRMIEAWLRRNSA